jgi:hypothetical protein
MAYRNGYRRGYGQRAVSAGRVSKPNRRPGACRECGEEIPAGAGQLWRETSGDWSVVHLPMEWSGSPVSGHYVGGCPASTDEKNAGAPWNADGHVRPEAERLTAVAASYAAMNPPEDARPRRAAYAYTSTGARMTSRCGHEDYPCCGC